MKLGLLTAPFSETPLMEVADWTAANGFDSIEIARVAPGRAGGREQQAKMCPHLGDRAATGGPLPNR